MEDMIVYWDAKGNCLARVILEADVKLEDAEEHIYPAMQDVFGKNDEGLSVVNNSSYEFSEEWG